VHVHVAFDLVVTDEWFKTWGIRTGYRDSAVDLSRPDVGIREGTGDGADIAGLDVDAAVDSCSRTRWGSAAISSGVDVKFAAR